MRKDSELERLKEIVRLKEDALKQHVAALQHLKAAIQALENSDVTVAGRSGVSHRKAPKKGENRPFAKKYDRSSKDLVVEMLSGRAPRGLSLREIMDLLAKQGKVYSVQAMSDTLKKLRKAGKIKKASAPPDSKSKFVYKIVNSSNGSDAGGNSESLSSEEGRRLQ